MIESWILNESVIHMPNLKPVSATGKMMANVAWKSWSNTMRITKEWKNGRQIELDKRGHKIRRLWITYERVGKIFLEDDRYSKNLSSKTKINSLNAELNPICYLLALLGAHHFPHVSRIRVKLLTFRLLMSYIHGAPILDVSRSHTTTQHSR